jgi:predicted hydrocarbon binding protein
METGWKSMSSSGERDSAAGKFLLPNKLGRVLLASLEDVMGRAGLGVILSHAKLRHLINNYPPSNLDLGWTFEETAALLQALEEIHGARAGQGVAMRAGRASLHYIQQDLDAVLGASEGPLRLVPLARKLKAGLHALADMYNKTSDQVVRVEDQGAQLLFRVDRCPVCWGRHSTAPICHMQAGLLEEAVSWVSGGQNLAVQEAECIAGGGSCCSFAIDKRPLR